MLKLNPRPDLLAQVDAIARKDASALLALISPDDLARTSPLDRRRVMERVRGRLLEECGINGTLAYLAWGSGPFFKPDGRFLFGNLPKAAFACSVNDFCQCLTQAKLKRVPVKLDLAGIPWSVPRCWEPDRATLVRFAEEQTRARLIMEGAA